jgi:hypothetical protein
MRRAHEQGGKSREGRGDIAQLFLRQRAIEA